MPLEIQSASSSQAAKLMTCLEPTHCCRPCKVPPTKQCGALLADKAFDADERVLIPLAAAGKHAVIPPKGNRKLRRSYDRHTYKARHLIENFFAKLKQFRAIATRYDKTARNLLGAIYLAAVTVWLS